MQGGYAATVGEWQERKAMNSLAANSLGVLAITATLIATGASAQGIYDRGSLSRQDSAMIDHVTIDHVTDAAHSTKAKERSARTRGASSYARAPVESARRGSDAFDGDWSVLIETRVGGCVPSFRYGVRIENGEVLNAGGAPVDVEGRVARSGAVQVSVAAGDQAAYGAGRLSQTSGGGTWRGRGSLGTCSGTWMAERRG
jgi:hypothetical protein